MSKPILEVNNLKVDFIIDGERVNAVHEVNFSLEKGKTLGIVGESGCGKSVSSTAIMRLLPKNNTVIDECSSIKLDGEELTTLTDKEFMKIRGDRISMIFQEPMTSLNPVYTIGTQLIEMVRAHQTITKKEAFDLCVEMLEKVGIPEPVKRMKQYPHQLSGGLRQRVMIAMALVCNPEVLIADEPTTALDVTIQAQILELMNKLKEDTKTSIILITHDMGVVAEVTDDVMVMYAGEIVEYADVKTIFHSPVHPYTIGLLNSIPKPNMDDEARLATIDGTVPTLRNMPDGCRFADRCPFCQEKCKNERPALKEFNGRKVRCFYAGDLRKKEAASYE